MKSLILYVLCKEKLGVDNWLGLKGLRNEDGSKDDGSCKKYSSRLVFPF